MTLHTRHALCLLVLTLLGCGAAFADEEDKKKGPPKLEACELGSTYNVHRVGKIYLAGQPSPEDFQLAKKEGVKTVINLRPDSELKWNEKDVLKDVGLEYHHFPFREPESLKDKVFDAAPRQKETAGHSALCLSESSRGGVAGSSSS